MKRVLAPVLFLLASCGAPPPDAGVDVAAAAAAAPAPADAAANGDIEAAGAPGGVAAETGVGAAARDDLVVLRFDCRGNDPDWRLRLTADGRGRLGEEAGDTDLAGRLERNGGGHAWRAAPVDAPSESFAALMTPVACFPPEGGNAKEFTAALSWADGRRADGCCQAVRGLDVYGAPDFVTASAGDWSADLPPHLDQVERCARDAGVDARAVVDLRENDDGKLVVRLRDSDRNRFDCLLDPGGGDIEAVATVAGDASAIGEGGSEWFPADPDAPPALACGRVYRTFAADGSLRGWLHQREGC